mmetsp:Transcript_34691/g.87195  ORF Transcript_34691/g.87195 Transcript_34691/m.87195 type:complete len:144 (+) Transcript_34691:384-815(+)
MDRARRPTVDFLSQNLHETHINLAKCRCGPHVAAELRGDGPAVEHLATGTEAVNRRMARRLADVICYTDVDRSVRHYHGDGDKAASQDACSAQPLAGRASRLCVCGRAMWPHSMRHGRPQTIVQVVAVLEDATVDDSLGDTRA